MPPRYRIRMSDGEPFEFEWDKPEKPTKRDVLSLYEARKKPVEEPSEPGFLSKVWKGISSPLVDIPETKGTGFYSPAFERATDWVSSRLVEPLTSPLGIGTAIAGGLGGPALKSMIGAGGAMFSAQQMPQQFADFNSNPSVEGAADIGLSGLGLAGGTAFAKKSLTPKATPFPVIDIPDYVPPKELLAQNPRTVQPIQLGPDPNAPLITERSTTPQAPLKSVEKITIPRQQVGLPDVPQLDAMSSMLGEPPAGTFGISNRGEMFPTVPSRMQSSTNQRVWDAILPSRTKEQIGQVQTTNPLTVVVEKFTEQPDIVTENTRTGLSARAQQLADDALSNVDEWGRTRVAKSDNPAIDAGIKNPTTSKVSLEADNIVKQARTSKPNNAPKKGEATTSEASPRKEVSVLEKLFQSGSRTLEKLGPTGAELNRKIQRIRADSDRMVGEAEANIRKYADKLTKDEQANFGNYVEGLKEIPNDTVRKAVEAYTTEVEKSGVYAEGAKLNIKNAKGDSVPFERIKEKYWARQYPEGYFDGPEGRQSLINELIKQGVDPGEAQNIAKNSAKFGERFIDSQHARQHYRIPGYRTDINAAYKHLRNIYRRSQEAIEFGPDDINDPKTADLIRKTGNPEVATKIMEQQLGRTKHDQQAQKLVHRINGVEAAISLPLAAVGNFSQRFALPMKTSMVNMAKVIKNVVMDSKGAKESAMRSGALEPVQAVFRDEGGLISKLYGLTATEEGNRIWASEAGKLEVADAFRKAKSGNANAKKRLSELLLDDADNITKQNDLTPEQVQRAQYRMAQITQGLTDPVDLPTYWNESPYMKLPTFLKRFAFQQSRMMKDALMENPVRNVAMGLGLYTLIGEGTADARAGIRTLLAHPFKDSEKGIQEELAAAMNERTEEGMFQKLSPGTMSWVADRVSSNLTNAFALGLLEDAINGVTSGDPASMLSFVTGKAITDASKLAKAGYQAGEELVSGEPTKAGKKIGRAASDLSPLTRPMGRELFSSKDRVRQPTKRFFTPSLPKVN